MIEIGYVCGCHIFVETGDTEKAKQVQKIMQKAFFPECDSEYDEKTQTFKVRTNAVEGASQNSTPEVTTT